MNIKIILFSFVFTIFTIFNAGFSSKSESASGSTISPNNKEKIEVNIKSSSLSIKKETKQIIPVNQELIQESTKIETIETTSTGNQMAPKITSGAVYAKVTSTVHGIPKYSTVEILSDRGNGKVYSIRKNGKTYSVTSKYLSIPANPKTDKSIMANDQVINYIKSRKITSKTNYIIFTDINRQKTYFIQKNSSGTYKVIKSTLSATGNNITPTIRGQFAIKSKRTHLNKKGSAINAMYAMQITGAYYYHSVLTNKYDRIRDNTIGKRASHGCVRNPMDVAKWAYQTIPIGTTVLIV